MNFKQLLTLAKNNEALNDLIEMYRPLLIKNSLINGKFDEDLYQELICTLILCVRTFK